MGQDGANVPEWVRQEWREIAAAGMFTRWRLGQGWKYVRPHFEVFDNGGFMIGDDSTSCVLLAFAELCKDRGLDPGALYREAYPEPDEPRLDLEDLETYRELTVLPRRWTPRTIRRLIDDLGEVNCHSLAGVAMEHFLPGWRRGGATRPAG